MSQSKNILIIGGAGFIGTHLIPQLVDTGRNVTVLDRIAPQNESQVNVSYIVGDFAKLELISHLLDSHQEVIHLAYATVPNTSFQNPLADLQQNLSPTVQLFSEAADREVKLVLVSSGGTVYGEAGKLPICENHPTKPISPYGVTKLTLENYAYLYYRTHNLKYVCVRPANAYGVGQRPFIGQGFISTALASAISGKPIKIYGKHGTIRDYLYVSCLASGIVSALEHGRLSETYNVGSGIGLSNLDVIKAFEIILGKIKIQIEYLPDRAFDVKANVLDSTKLQMDTGWRQLVGFEEGLELLYGWLKRMGK